MRVKLVLAFATFALLLVLIVLAQSCRDHRVFDTAYPSGRVPDEDVQDGTYDVTMLAASARMHPGKKSAAALLVKLNQPGLTRKQQMILAGPLARCGGPEAARWLRGFYDGLRVKAHAVVKPPYTIPPDTVEDWQTDRKPYEGWQQAKTYNGGKAYCTFTRNGPGSFCDIFLAVDGNADGKYDELLYTGLLNYAWFPIMRGAVPTPPKTRLLLKVAGDMVTLTHNAIRMTPPSKRTGYSTPYNVVRTAELSLKALTIDSDHDGFTDVTEEALGTDPAKADTDGDGITDALDPEPLADPAKMNALERGVERTLDFALAFREIEESWIPYSKSEPYDFVDLSAAGLPNLAWTSDPSVYGIVMQGAGERPGRTGGMIVNAISRSEVETYLKRGQLDPFPELERAIAIYNAAGRWKSLKYSAAYFVALNWRAGGRGCIITLVNLEGEYYPVEVITSWVS